MRAQEEVDGEKTWNTTLFKAECNVADKYAKLSTTKWTHPPSLRDSYHVTSFVVEDSLRSLSLFSSKFDSQFLFSCSQIFAWHANSICKIRLFFQNLEGLKINTTLICPSMCQITPSVFRSLHASFRNEFRLRKHRREERSSSSHRFYLRTSTAGVKPLLRSLRSQEVFYCSKFLRPTIICVIFVLEPKKIETKNTSQKPKLMLSYFSSVIIIQEKGSNSDGSMSSYGCSYLASYHHC